MDDAFTITKKSEVLLEFLSMVFSFLIRIKLDHL